MNSCYVEVSLNLGDVPAVVLADAQLADGLKERVPLGLGEREHPNCAAPDNAMAPGAVVMRRWATEAVVMLFRRWATGPGAVVMLFTRWAR